MSAFGKASEAVVKQWHDLQNQHRHPLEVDCLDSHDVCCSTAERETFLDRPELMAEEPGACIYTTYNVCGLNFPGGILQLEFIPTEAVVVPNRS